MSESYEPAQASSLRKGGYILIKDRPCKVIDMSTSKTGKHGHAKVNFVATDIFTGKKIETICQSTHNVNVPHVTREEFLLLDIEDDGYMTLMVQETGETREDMKLGNSDIEKKIWTKLEEGFELLVTVIFSMGEQAVIDYKENK